MTPLHLYSIPVCPFAQRAKIVLQLKAIPFDLTELDITRPMPQWFITLNPEERVPVLKHDDFILAESSVITEYLNEVFPTPPLFPTDAKQRARSRLAIQWANDTFIPTMYELLMNQDRSKDPELTATALEQFSQLDRWLLDWNPHGTWMFDTFGMVDLSFAPFFQRYCLNEHYRGFKIPPVCPRLQKWIEACLAHETVIKTGLSRERYIELYFDYSLGYGDGQVPPGREKSSFALS